MIANSQIIPINNSLVSRTTGNVSVIDTDIVVDATVRPVAPEEVINAEVISIDASVEDVSEDSTEPDFIQAINHNLTEVLSSEAIEQQNTISLGAFIRDLLNNSTDSDYVRTVNHNLASVLID